MEGLEIVKFFGKLLVELKWPIFLFILLWKANKVKEIISAFKNMDIDMNLGGQKFKINSTKITSALDDRIHKLSIKTSKFKPFPHASREEYKGVVQIIRAMEFLGITSEKINNLAVLKCMGGYYFMVGNFDKALEYFLNAERQVEKKSNENGEVDIYTNLGYLYIVHKKYELAVTKFKKAKIIDQSSPWSELGIGDCYRLSGANSGIYEKYYDRAIAIFEKQINSNKLNYLANYGLALTWRGKKENTKALDCFAEVTKLEPEFDVAYYMVAIMKLKIEPKDVDGAMENMRRAINLNPELKNWVKKDAYEDEDLKPIREDKCFKCIVL